MSLRLLWQRHGLLLGHRRSHAALKGERTLFEQALDSRSHSFCKSTCIQAFHASAGHGLGEAVDVYPASGNHWSWSRLAHGRLLLGRLVSRLCGQRWTAAIPGLLKFTGS